MRGLCGRFWDSLGKHVLIFGGYFNWGGCAGLYALKQTKQVLFNISSNISPFKFLQALFNGAEFGCCVKIAPYSCSSALFDKIRKLHWVKVVGGEAVALIY